MWIDMRTGFHDVALRLNRPLGYAQSFSQGFDVSKPQATMDPLKRRCRSKLLTSDSICTREINVANNARTLDGLPSHDGPQGLRGRASLAILGLATMSPSVDSIRL
jgi:hypothetical protein